MTDNANDYLIKNKEAWNSRTDHHVDTAFYDTTGFLAGKNMLNDIELELLGDISGKKVLHLQCHFGLDTLSMARMGAEVTGADFSDHAIKNAIELTDKAGLKARFICCNVYDLHQYLDESFDIVFTSYGTIGWLPDLDKWASIVNRYLKPGGKFVFAEFHPVVWMFDNDFKEVAYSYHKSEPIIETESGTYADKSAPIQTEMITWNHGLAEVFSSLLSQGLTIRQFKEYDYSPYNCFSHTEEISAGKFRIKHLGNRIPMVYALLAEK